MHPNRTWHQANQLTALRTQESRIGWYLKHAANCGCTSIPREVMHEIERRGILVPRGYGIRWYARPPFHEDSSPFAVDR